jgi:hypothetical protein
MGHYMTKEGTPIKCKSCLYWTRKIMNTGTCGHASQKLGRYTNSYHSCSEFWPKAEYRL